MRCYIHSLLPGSGIAHQEDLLRLQQIPEFFQFSYQDLVDFEVYPVMTSAEAADKISPRL